jgi:hypothetical protein
MNFDGLTTRAAITSEGQVEVLLNGKSIGEMFFDPKEVRFSPKQSKE